MYVRPAKHEELKNWLIATGLVPKTRVDALAKALIEKFDVVGRFVNL